MRSTASQQQPHISALLLAAGSSSRFGNDNKLLTSWRGELLIHHSLKSIAESDVSDIAVVTGHEHELIANAINRTDYDKPIQLLHNIDYQTGMASSLVHGVSTFINSDAIVVCLGDMPKASSDVINTLVDAYIQDPDKSMYIPAHKGKRGNPVLIAKCLFDSVLGLKGDIGARALAQQYPQSVVEVPTECRGIHQDVDITKDLWDL